jgi:hypothetical protein
MDASKVFDDRAKAMAELEALDDKYSAIVTSVNNRAAGLKAKSQPQSDTEEASLYLVTLVSSTNAGSRTRRA